MRPKKSLVGFLSVILIFLAVSGVLAQTSYTIQPGDTLSSIARRFNVSVQAIAAANSIVNPNLIYAGQVILIPDDSAPPANPDSPTTPLPPSPAGPGTSVGTYTIQRGDTLYKIAISHGVTVAALVQANGITNPNIIYAGQVLIIPGSGTGDQQLPNPTPLPPAPVNTPPPPVAPPQAPTLGPNVLPNPSFEEGYYHINGVPELQVPNGWQFNFDQGQPAPGTGHTFLRPEIRVMPRWLLPKSEQPLFIWNGDWTVKVFKGGAPVSFRLFTDVYLQPGTYRFSASYYPDLIEGYNGGRKIFTSQSAAGEVAFINDGIGAWSSASPGSKNTMVQTFSVTNARSVRVGVAFRTRYQIMNNGYFIDDWSLQRISD